MYSNIYIYIYINEETTQGTALATTNPRLPQFPRGPLRKLPHFLLEALQAGPPFAIANLTRTTCFTRVYGCLWGIHIYIYVWIFYDILGFKKNTFLCVIPTMTFIHFLTGKSSGILSDIFSGILSGILSGISSGILSGKSSGILSYILSGISIWHISRHFIWHIFWHSIWHSIWHIF